MKDGPQRNGERRHETQRQSAQGRARRSLGQGRGIFIAWLPLFAVGLWFIYRVARGWVALKERRPMYA